MSSTAQVIPFQFEAREVRTLLIGDQPWFCAADVCAVLGYANSRKAVVDNCREAGVTTSDIRSGGQKRRVTFISEGNLYRLIIKSRKDEALRFESWVCDEVLPTIRKHGRYEDTSGKMDTLLGQTIGTDGFHMLGAIIKGKVVSLPQAVQRRATAKIWSQTHAAFGVRSAADIPADQLDAARNFIAAYALEGEWLRKKPEPKTEPRLDIHFPVDYLSGRRPGTQYHRNEHTDFLEVFPLDLVDPAESPCELILTRLTKAGYNVAAAWWEVRTYRNKLAQMHRAIESLKRNFESPQQYVIAKPDLI
ncbi:BRO-N domain-containing protein [Azotobacter chroococcum]|uniref:BRO-N domain-containing protein n=1 Tax=Azotobacter chroococcum TaxID=353 RepID=UPI000B785F83|nr:Bro-N domain-containing protein [Azotobacter chroococcum]